MSTIVTAMKTAKTASRTNTISDCARSTKRAPTKVIPPSPTMTAEVKRLSQPASASSPTKRCSSRRRPRHRADDHDRGEVAEPGGDPDQAPVPETLQQVRDRPARGRIAHAELDDVVAQQGGACRRAGRRARRQSLRPPCGLAEHAEDAAPTLRRCRGRRRRERSCHATICSSWACC